MEVYRETFQEICRELEDLAAARLYTPSMSTRMRAEIASSAQELASCVASQADTIAIEEVLESDPKRIMYTDSEVAALRVRTLDAFMEGLERSLDRAFPTPGQYRRNARIYFVTKLRQAVDLALSKHDQVVMLGHSRIGRVQLPSCLACDRPLINVSRDRGNQGGDGDRSHELARSIRSRAGVRIDSNMRPKSGVRPATSGGIRSGPRLERNLDPAARIEAMTSKPGFVYRGGFKMPRASRTPAYALEYDSDARPGSPESYAFPEVFK